MLNVQMSSSVGTPAPLVDAARSILQFAVLLSVRILHTAAFAVNPSEEIAVSLSPTSYALLGLLSIRPWSTYELAQQATRSLRFVYPRAERHLYAEAKRLADTGLARADVSFTGKRRRTTYAITPAGTKALRAWLRTEPAPPVLEAEVLLRSFFADCGRPADLVAALDAARAHAAGVRHELASMAGEWLDDTAPFPERAAVGALTMRFVADFHRLVEEWAEWAAGEVATWDDADGTGWDGARTVMADVAGRA
jgi:DNA-binding PadR family transcriptional regulator